MNISLGSKHILAFQIDNGVTQVAELRVHAKNVSVLKSFSVLTAKGTVEDDGTLVASPEFVDLLKEQILVHGIKADRAVFCVNSDQIISREVTIPNIKRSQILTLLATNAQDYFPVDVSDYKLDYSLQEQIVENGAKMLRILASAVPKHIIASYYALAKMLEIGVEAIDISGNSVLQAIGVNPGMITDEADTEGSTYLVANLYSGGTQLTFIKEGTVRLQRTVSMGLDDKFEHYLLANQTEVGEIVGYAPAEIGEDEKAEALAECDRKASDLAAMINRIIEYYYSVEGYGNGKIFGTVVGQGILLPALTEHIFSELDVVYRLPHRASVHADDPGKLGAQYGLYLPCIGACLHPLNLTDRVLGMALDNVVAKRRWLERGIFIKDHFIMIAGVAVFGICVLISVLLAGFATVDNLTIKQSIKDYQQKIEVFSEVAQYQEFKLNAESIRDLLVAYTQKLEQLEQDKLVYEELKAEHEALAETYLALQDACTRLELDIPIVKGEYDNEYAVYNDFSKSIWAWYEEIMYTLDEEYMNTNNDNLVSFIEELEKKMPADFTVTAISITDQGLNMAVEVMSKEQVIYVIQTLREFDTVEIRGISGLTVVDGGFSGPFEEEINGNPNPKQRVRFTISLAYTDAFREN